MRRVGLPLVVPSMLFAGVSVLWADTAGPQLTIYNQAFALVKETRSLSLRRGVNEARVSDVTALLEADSVILRDPSRPDGLRVLEQNYEGDPLSQGYLLRQYEGRSLQFRRVNPATGQSEIVAGKVIRSGYTPVGGGWRTPGGRGAIPSLRHPGVPSPIVEVEGKIQFTLPGQPLFDALAGDAILRPTLLWTLWTDRSGSRDVELSYLTGGMRWEATYNLIAPEQGDRFDLTGWVTLENASGAEFKDARVKLMAGDVSKIQPGLVRGMGLVSLDRMEAAPAPSVTEKPFDEYHLYTLERPTTLRDREIKQVEFCRGTDVPGLRFYVYDGARLQGYGRRDVDVMRTNPSYGTQGNTRVSSMLEFQNTSDAGLGIPLPRGTMKIYRSDADGGREFIGEDVVDHTPADETVRLFLGHAFDLVGERRQTNFRVDRSRETADESFEIRLRNHKNEEVEIRVVEHLYRWVNWRIRQSSDPYIAVDARTVEFRVSVPPGGERVVTYSAHYSW